MFIDVSTSICGSYYPTNSHPQATRSHLPNKCQCKKTPDLVDVICHTVKLQFANVWHAIRCQANYQLVAHMQHFLMCHTKCLAKSSEESKPRKWQPEITLTDGKLIIPATPYLAKKPCQYARVWRLHQCTSGIYRKLPKATEGCWRLPKANAGGYWNFALQMQCLNACLISLFLKPVNELHL